MLVPSLDDIMADLDSDEEQVAPAAAPAQRMPFQPKARTNTTKDEMPPKAAITASLANSSAKESNGEAIPSLQELMARLDDEECEPKECESRSNSRPTKKPESNRNAGPTEGSEEAIPSLQELMAHLD